MRNVFCPHYKRCLDHAAKANLPDMRCDDCNLRDESGKIYETDFTEYYLLLLAIFKPELYHKYREVQTREALNIKQ